MKPFFCYNGNFLGLGNDTQPVAKVQFFALGSILIDFLFL